MSVHYIMRSLMYLPLLLQVLARAGAHRNIPPHHLEATSPEAAYVMSELFPQQVWDATGAVLLLGASEDAGTMERIKTKGAVSIITFHRKP